MPKELKTIGRILIAVFIIVNTAMPANAALVFTNDVFQNEASIFRIGQNYDAATNDIELQFGTTNTETFMWNQADQAFKFSDDVNFDSNQMLAARLENATGANSLPGGAGGLGVGGRGRIVQLTGTDTVAPGCTISPNCGGGTYVWDGGTWISLTGTTSSNFNKLVTVGSTGSDYTTIANAAAYLQTLSGGIILLSAETHNVTTAVNMTNLIMIGKEASRTTINITGAGRLDSFDTTYEYMTISTGTITDDMAIDVQTGSNALLFNYVDINIQDAGDSLIDSNAGTPPTSTMKFIKSNMAGGSGTILKTKALSNLNTSSAIYIDSRSSDAPLQMSDWDLTLAGGGSVNTSGIISPIPADSIVVSPNMNLQGAIDSLEAAGNGGLITLLPGTYNITSPLTINDDGIEIVGYGDSSVISASGFTGGSTVAAIQVGAANSTAAKSNVVLKDFKLQVSGTGVSDIHGIRITGGSDNRIDNVTVEKLSGASGTGAAARMGIQMTDAAVGCTGTCVLTRPVITKSRVLGTSAATAYFTDGIHVTSDPSYSGVFGNNQGIINALVDGNNVDYVAETAYVFVGASNSSLFNNRGSRMGASGGGAYGIFMGNVHDTNMTANVFNSSLSATAIAIGLDPFNTGALKQTLDSIFSNNVIDGTSSGGLGFATGFQVGNATNVEVSRNTFQNNTIKGAAVGTTTAFTIAGNADDNTISDNDIYGNGNGWDTGINLGSALQERNLISLNRFVNITTLITDTGTGTKIGLAHHRAAANPTVNDDAGDGYEVGMVWVNTTANTSYVLTDETVGAAVWQTVGGSTGTDFEGVYATDADKILTTSNGAFTIAAGTGAVNVNSTTGGVSLNNNINGAVNIGTGTSTGAVSIGGGSNTVAVNSTSWDISTAGLATGLTGITSTGNIVFTGATSFRPPQAASEPGSCNVGQIYYNTTTNDLWNCTTTNTWTKVGMGSVDFENVYLTDADKILTTSNGAFTIAAGSGAVAVNSTGTGIVTIGNSTGKVGIGTASPQHMLDVNGSLYSRRYAVTDPGTGTIAIDWNNGNTQSVTITGTGRTVTFANGRDGGKYVLIVKQDATGSRTITTWPATVRWPTGGAITLTTTASKSDYIGFIYNGVDTTYDAVAFMTNL